MPAGSQASGVVEQARDLARQALAVARGSDPAVPLGLIDRALELLSALGPTETLADVVRWKGNILRDCGDHARALDMYAQSLAMADATFYTIGRAHALNCFGTMDQCRGDVKRAVSWYRSAQRLANGLGDRRLLGMIEQNLGIAAATSGQRFEALEHFRLALREFEQTGDQLSALWVLNNLGNLYTREKSYDLAAPALEGALILARSLGDVASEGIVQENRAKLLVAMGQLDEAHEAATRALEIAESRRDATRQAAALAVHASILRHRDARSPEILVTLDRALELAQTGEDAELKREIMGAIADASEQVGDVAKSVSYRQAAVDRGSAYGMPGATPCPAAPEPPSPPAML